MPESMEAWGWDALPEHERDVLRECIREVAQSNPNLSLPWMKHSPCDEVWSRALASATGGEDAKRSPGA